MIPILIPILIPTKAISTLSVCLGMLLLSGCGDENQITKAGQEVPASSAKKITINPDNFMAGQVEALNKAKAVERVLLEASKNRLKSIE